MQQVSAPPAQAMPQANALELNDIHIPEQISNLPVAYGWWILVASIILLTIFTIVKVRKSAKINLVRKQALAQLKNNSEMTISDTIILLKWAGIHYFSRIELAKLFGDSLQKFLASQLPIKYQQNFTDLSSQAFLNQYHAEHAAVDKNLYQAATLWLTHALPPKELKKPNKNASLNDNDSQGANA